MYFKCSAICHIFKINNFLNLMSNVRKKKIRYDWFIIWMYTPLRTMWEIFFEMPLTIKTRLLKNIKKLI